MAEVIIYYHLYNKKFGTVDVSAQQTGTMAPAVPVFTNLARAVAVIGIGLILFSFAPGAYAWVRAKTDPPVANFQLSQTEVKLLTVTGDTHERTYEPSFDPKLPLTNHLTIPSIGVDTDIQEATYDNYEEALKRGVWRVSNFGAPNGTGKPVILAAHRFGYLAWTNLYRRENSFYNLPKLKIGDTVEIIYQQRKYLYEVYATAKGSEITDYSADLILYTCETLTGPERIFVYARLLGV